MLSSATDYEYLQNIALCCDIHGDIMPISDTKNLHHDLRFEDALFLNEAIICDITNGINDIPNVLSNLNQANCRDWFANANIQLRTFRSETQSQYETYNGNYVYDEINLSDSQFTVSSFSIPHVSPIELTIRHLNLSCTPPSPAISSGQIQPNQPLIGNEIRLLYDWLLNNHLTRIIPDNANDYQDYYLSGKVRYHYNWEGDSTDYMVNPRTCLSGRNVEYYQNIQRHFGNHDNLESGIDFLEGTDGDNTYTTDYSFAIHQIEERVVMEYSNSVGAVFHLSKPPKGNPYLIFGLQFKNVYEYWQQPQYFINGLSSGTIIFMERLNGSNLTYTSEKFLNYRYLVQLAESIGVDLNEIGSLRPYGDDYNPFVGIQFTWIQLAGLHSGIIANFDQQYYLPDDIDWHYPN